MPSFLQEVKRRVAPDVPPPFWAWTRRHLSTIAFVSGFVLDNLTLTRVDVLLNHLYLVSLFAVTGLGIVYIQIIDTGHNSLPFLKRYRAWLPVVVQFGFGSLLSAFLIFYTRGASLLASWPFLLILAILFFGNEIMKSRYEQLLFQINVFFFSLFSYITFLLPVAFRHIGDMIFLASGLVSLMLILLFLVLLRYIVPFVIEQHRRPLLVSLGLIYLAFNLCYFLNFIPPLPLSLTHIGTYHTVTRSPQGGYVTTYEKSPWYVFWRDTSNTFHAKSSETMYCFSAVFAPARLTTTIVSGWEYFDPKKDRWVQKGTVTYDIIGGREGGYRGYSLRKNPEQGTWRCSIKNTEGQTLGTITTTVEKVVNAPELSERLQ